MPQNPDHLVETADIIAVDTEGGEVRVTLGDAQRGYGQYREVPIYASGCFVSVPTEPSDGNASQALFLNDGHAVKAIGWRDNRTSYTDRVGSMESGDAAIISDSEARLLLKRAKDLIALFSTNSDGNSMMITVDGDNDQVLLHSGGAYISMGKDEIVFAVNGGGAMRLSTDGFSFQGNNFEAAAKSIKMGGTLPPGPNLPTQAVAVGPGGPVNVVVPTIGFYP